MWSILKDLVREYRTLTGNTFPKSTVFLFREANWMCIDIFLLFEVNLMSYLNFLTK